MKTKSESALKMSLRDAGYSEKTAEQILRWYTLPEKTKVAQRKLQSTSKTF